MTAATDTLGRLLTTLEARRGELDHYRQAWDGERPAAFLSEASRKALDKRLLRLGVNFPRFGTLALVDRLNLTGLQRAGDSEADPDLDQIFRMSGLGALSELVHTDRTFYGSAYVTVWNSAAAPNRPIVTADNPFTMAVERDPATGEVLAAVRRWVAAGKTHAVLFTAQHVTRFTANGPDAPALSGAWSAGDPVANPLQVVPVTPFVRRMSTTDVDGTSFVADVLDLSDAVAKVLGDAMVTSEHFARPRRWATGLEIEEDEDGQPVDPFPAGRDRLMQSEDPATKFGQFDGARLDGYGDLLGTLTQQIGATLGLPGHYLGLHGDQPPNADSVRAAEVQLTTRAYSEIRQIVPEWTRVGGLMQSIVDGRSDPEAGNIVPVFASPETRTPAQAADAAAKLAGIGVPLRSLLADPLGYSPSDADDIMRAQSADLTRRAGLDLSRLLPRTTP